ncbi:MAG: hypothetical protein OSA40_00500 [Phycisphaerales bacterium]|nr:hypothetical protein [Phycisphaerales bacterium]
MRHTRFHLGSIASIAIGSSAFAQSTADFTVDEGSIAVVTLTVTVDTTIGTSSDTDSMTQGVTGFATGNFDSSIPPFLVMELPTLLFDLGTGGVDYSLFCLPIFGCQELNIVVSDFVIQIDAPAPSAPFDGPSAFFPDAPFVSSFNYDVTGDLIEISGSNVVPDFYSFGTDVFVGKGDSIFMQNLYLQSFTFGLDPKDLPVGVNSVEILVEVDLNNTTLTGILKSTGGCPEDMNGDGTVNGADLGLLLAAWGTDGGDFNGDGTTNGADLGLLLAAWGTDC